MVPSAWHQHAPFAFWITEALQPDTFVELGTHYGFSYLVFCQAVKRLGLRTKCCAIDTWKGDVHAGFYDEDVFAKLNDLHECHYSDFSRLVRSTFDEALSRFPDGTIDLLHIDGRHRYEDIAHDFSSWLPKLSDRGVVLLHDINVRERGFGVWRFWEEINQQYPAFEFLHCHGLGVLNVGRVINEALHALLYGTGPARVAIRETYAQLGRLITGSFESDQHRAEAEERLRRVTAECDERVAVLQAQISDLCCTVERLKRRSGS